jgi:hypothetical protein
MPQSSDTRNRVKSYVQRLTGLPPRGEHGTAGGVGMARALLLGSVRSRDAVTLAWCGTGRETGRWGDREMRAVIAVEVLERSRRLSGPGTAGRRGPRPTSRGSEEPPTERLPGGRRPSDAGARKSRVPIRRRNAKDVPPHEGEPSGRPPALGAPALGSAQTSGRGLTIPVRTRPAGQGRSEPPQQTISRDLLRRRNECPAGRRTLCLDVTAGKSVSRKGLLPNGRLGHPVWIRGARSPLESLVSTPGYS